MAEAQKILGSAIQRREDPALITGEGQYTDDIQEAALVYAAMVRSPHAHARINNIDTSKAEDAEGVIAVYTADDLDIPGELPVGWLLDTLKTPAHPILARDKVRYVGDAVAVVVAEDRYQAQDATELVEVDYEVLEASVDARKATDSSAPPVHDEVSDNVAFNWEIGSKEDTDQAFRDADQVVDLHMKNQRLIPNAMEPRSTLADYKPRADKLVVKMTSQNPHVHRLLMSGVLDFPEHKMQIIAPEVGGGFGSKIHHYADEALVSWCSMQLERPVKWTARRSETYITDAHGRDHISDVELAVDRNGKITGLRVKTHAAMGAYLSTFAPAVPTYLYGTLLSGQYQIPNIYCNVVGTFTNTVPTDAYRGAGRPEACFLIERIIHKAATELGMDPAEFRRQNFVPGDAFPYDTPVAVTYDSGDYEKTLNRAMDMLDYDSLRQKQEQLRNEGRYLGIGMSCYIEACGIAPSQVAGALGAQAGLWENGTVKFHPSGKVTAYCGTSGHGQGHKTSYAQIVSDRLGIPYEDIEVIEGDTDEVSMGMGTYGSRSAAVGGSALVRSCEKIVDKARRLAAHELEADEADIEFEDGEFAVRGAPDRSVTIQDISLKAYLAHSMPEGEEPGLEATSFYDPENFTFPFGCYIAVIEVDPDSGEIEFQRFVGVDDVGNQINPMIVEGQIQGGLAQGIGQALYEEAIYDDDGNLTTGSMMDYAVPKAMHIPDFETDSTVTPSPHNPLGVKGVGEAGTIGAPPAVVNAIVDALSPFGVDHIDMPVTPEKVWQAIKSARE